MKDQIQYGWLALTLWVLRVAKVDLFARGIMAWIKDEEHLHEYKILEDVN
jgi:hypothetical protein